jgi:hypothetical protein
VNDRELLEMAAKAMHLPENFSSAAYMMGWSNWNPLTDDGDAFRLAVKLGIDVDHYSGWVETWKAGFDGFIADDYGDDPCAATRRAIVRAAAEIGRSMQ